MTCMQTEDCWCADCTDRAIAAEQAASQPKPKASAGPVDIAWIFEYGLAEKLTNSVRCF